MREDPIGAIISGLPDGVSSLEPQLIWFVVLALIGCFVAILAFKALRSQRRVTGGDLTMMPAGEQPARPAHAVQMPDAFNVDIEAPAILSQAIEPISIWLEKIEGSGEDAWPVVSIRNDHRSGYIAAFDGMGGSGSAKFLVRGEIRTGAYLAARLAADVVAQYIVGPNGRVDEPQSLIESPRRITQLHRADDELGTANTAFDRSRETDKNDSDLSVASVGGIALVPHQQPDRNHNLDERSLSLAFDSTFSKASARLVPSGEESKVKGRGIRRLPTTVSALSYEIGENQVELVAVWAGDSRAYYLSDEALDQITSDDVKAPNTLHPALPSDAPLSNYISEVAPNRLNSRRVVYYRPGVIFVCTDGAYNYFQTPIHFETMLRAQLRASNSCRDWAQRLANVLGTTAGDDVSMVMVPIGYASFGALREALTSRGSALRDTLLSKYEQSYAALLMKNQGLATAKEQLKEAEQAAAEERAVYEASVKELLDRYQKSARFVDGRDANNGGVR